MYRSVFKEFAIWDTGQYTQNLYGPVIKVRFAGENGNRLLKLDGTILTEPYKSFGDWHTAEQKYIKVHINRFAPRSEYPMFTFLTYPGFTQVTPEVFESLNSSTSLNRQYKDKPGFVAIVKHNGRWKVLFADGSLEKIAKKD